MRYRGKRLAVTVLDSVFERTRDVNEHHFPHVSKGQGLFRAGYFKYLGIEVEFAKTVDDAYFADRRGGFDAA